MGDYIGGVATPTNIVFLDVISRVLYIVAMSVAQDEVVALLADLKPHTNECMFIEEAIMPSLVRKIFKNRLYHSTKKYCANSALIVCYSIWRDPKRTLDNFTLYGALRVIARYIIALKWYTIWSDMFF